jgi:predicted adenine nucleotide alpha hydrolase (AANH) superfamily ATPase
LKPRLLLHICCASCAVYVFRKLSDEYAVTGYFYNPNIQPSEEYLFRFREAMSLSRRNSWPMIFGPYNPDDWLKSVEGKEELPERGERCSVCFSLRLRKTFEIARSERFDVVASTLSISPYKSTDQINREGLVLSHEYDLRFLAENFKKKNGYRLGKAMAMELGITHQNYCGCVFSKRDREKKLSQKG